MSRKSMLAAAALSMLSVALAISMAHVAEAALGGRAQHPGGPAVTTQAHASDVHTEMRGNGACRWCWPYCRRYVRTGTGLCGRCRHSVSFHELVPA